MKQKLTSKETIVISSMLFGMFFGAGNLIFPATLGPTAGSNLVPAYLGLFLTAVGLPLLAVAALGKSRCNGVVELSGKVGRKYGVFFSTLLYLTIGPLFAAPRCGSTSFAVGAVKLIGSSNQTVAQAVFTFLFFAAVLFFALRPGKIMTWIGKILNPVFLVFLGVLVVAALFNPVDSVAALTPAEAYATGSGAFFKGFLEGYNTLDALAGLAFGMIVIEVIRQQGVTDPDAVASSTAKAGIFSCLFMGIIYLAITVVAAQSSSVCAGCDNGGAVLGTIADYYFGSVGSVLMTAIVTFACLKTAIGLITACSSAFESMFPKGPSYRGWVIIFCVICFGVANFGLNSIVAYCVPVLMFIYPLACTLILLALFEKRFGGAREVYVWTTALTLISAFCDFCGTLSGTLQGSGVTATGFLDAIAGAAGKILPFNSIGLGWVCPAILGFIIGLVLSKTGRTEKAA